MKLIRWKGKDRSYPGVEIENRYFDVSAFVEDYNESFFATEGILKLKKFVAEHSPELKALPANVLLDSPVARPSKIICVGLNYADHARETGAVPPQEPVLFLKASTALCGPYDNIILPRGSLKTDWEVELAVIMAKKASYVQEQEALSFVAGFCLFNDLSEREFQMERGGTWDKGKGCDSFGPLGPLLVTPDEIADINNLRLWLKVNGKLMQDSSTANLIFKVPFLIAYISSFMTLLPGDIISTGTPGGVGLAKSPPCYLKQGDQVELGIDGLGTATQKVVLQ